MKVLFLFAFGVVLSGCTSPVYLKHAETGEVVECGPYAGVGGLAAVGAMRETKCIDDFRAQGYQRIAKP